MTDDERELAILKASLKMQTAKTPEERREAWQEFKTLHEGRSDRQIAKMERERWLR